jgi:hypothetical protein
MIVVSFAEACRRLSIDAKTLHRWLAEAELSLPCHPCDGRKKGVNEEHLQVLARLHHRRLAGGEQEGATQQACQIPLLPADLLALPEQLSAMQAQLAVLQQQVAALTRLVTLHGPEPALPLVPTKSTSTAKREAQPTRSAPRSRLAASATAKAPPKSPVHVIPRVEYGEQGRYVVICPKKGLLPLEPDTEEWFAWVAEQDSFRFVGKWGYFTAHHEWRVPKGAWRAHRHIRNRVYIQRLAPNHELTIVVLEQAALALQAHLM